MRAISLRTARSRPWLSSCPVAAWKRRLNSSILASASLTSSSSSAEVRRSAAASPLAITPHLALALRTWRLHQQSMGSLWSLASRLTQLSLHELALHGQLVHGPAQRLAGDLLGDTRELEHHPARLHVGHPPLRRALARAHPGLGRLLGQRAVRVDRDPHLPATADVPGHGDTGGLDLPVGHVGVLHRLDAELAERHPGAALGGPVPVRPVLLAVLDPPRDQHVLALPARSCCGRGGSGRSRALAARSLGARGPAAGRRVGATRAVATVATTVAAAVTAVTAAVPVLA